MQHKVILATCLGFCGGVKRAVRLVEEQARGSHRVYTYGPLVHNPQLIESFESRGIKVLDANLERVEKGSVVIRAHGVAPRVFEKLESQGFTIIDGTCKKVSASQKLIKQYGSQGYHVYIVGDPGHGEVLGLQGQIKNCTVIDHVEQVQSLTAGSKNMVISQTTIGKELFDGVVDALKMKDPDLVVINRICSATDQRQQALKDLFPQVDGLVVIGGRNSANTARLFQIAQTSGKPSWLIERAEELDLKEMEHCPVIGITAGASTPESMITETVKLLTDSP